MVLQTKKGIELTEAANIAFNNVKLVTSGPDPLVYLQNSNGIEFANISYNDKASVLFSVNGERSKNIRINKTDLSKAKSKTEFKFGANASSVEFK